MDFAHASHELCMKVFNHNLAQLSASGALIFPSDFIFYHSSCLGLKQQVVSFFEEIIEIILVAGAGFEPAAFRL